MRVIDGHHHVAPAGELLQQRRVLLLDAGEGVAEEHQRETPGVALAVVVALERGGIRDGRVRRRLHLDETEVIHHPPGKFERLRQRRRQQRFHPMRPAPLAATTRRAKTRVVPLLVFRRLGGDVFATAREVRREHRLRLLVLGPRLGIARRRFGRGFGRGFVGVAFVFGVGVRRGVPDVRHHHAVLREGLLPRLASRLEEPGSTRSVDPHARGLADAVGPRGLGHGEDRGEETRGGGEGGAGGARGGDGAVRDGWEAESDATGVAHRGARDRRAVGGDHLPARAVELRLRGDDEEGRAAARAETSPRAVGSARDGRKRLRGSKGGRVSEGRR